MAAKLLVTGGNGFIGAQVCRRAVAHGLEVVSVARRGRPSIREAWADQVAWIAADVFAPEQWRSHLTGCAALIHCVGIAWQRPRQNLTFERFNGDAAIVAAQQAVQMGVGAFVFISASHNPPLISSSYLNAKRRAENVVSDLEIRSVFLRPSLVYGPQRPLSVLPGLLLNLGASMRLPLIGSFLHENRALRVERVAAMAVRGALDPTLHGIVDIDTMERLTARPSQALTMKQAEQRD